MLSDEEAAMTLDAWGFDDLRSKGKVFIAPVDLFKESGPWHRACGQGNTGMCRWLKARGAADMINDKDQLGWTPLYYALSQKHEKTATWMIANGADVTANDNRGG